MRELDVRDLACPGPVLKLKELLEAGEREISLWVADELCRSNVTRFAASRGAEVESRNAEEGTFLVSITAPDDAVAAAPGEEALLTCELPASSGHPTVVQIGSETMGSGDDELGTLLLRSFLKTQLDLQQPPDLVLFYNSGVRLCCTGSTLIDDLRNLVAHGIEILACGTCLNYFGIADRLEVGRVTDMLEIASRLAGAARTVRP